MDLSSEWSHTYKRSSMKLDYFERARAKIYFSKKYTLYWTMERVGDIGTKKACENDQVISAK
jgi:hypothetical protein